MSWKRALDAIFKMINTPRGFRKIYKNHSSRFMCLAETSTWLINFPPTSHVTGGYFLPRRAKYFIVTTCAAWVEKSFGCKRWRELSEWTTSEKDKRSVGGKRWLPKVCHIFQTLLCSTESCTCAHCGLWKNMLAGRKLCDALFEFTVEVIFLGNNSRKNGLISMSADYINGWSIINNKFHV